MGSTVVRGVQRECWGGRVPTVRPCDADFALAGKAALDGPDWASRMVLFLVYYLGLALTRMRDIILGLSGHSWVNWTEQIRNRGGKELLSRGMFPTRKYSISGG